MDKTDKVVVLIRRCVPHAAESIAAGRERVALRCSPSGDDSSIRYGMGAIKGVGQGSGGDDRRTRCERSFKRLADLCRRIDLQRVNRRVLEAMIRSGCLDRVGANRATLMQHCPRHAAGGSDLRARAVGQNDMFGLMDTTPNAPAVVQMETLPDWSRRVRLTGSATHSVCI